MIIPKITASYIYSKLGNNSSLVPLAIKDIANSCGLTTASYLAGDTVEGKDRFIDEFGTQAIWLWGIPVYKKLLNIPFFSLPKFDPEIDPRMLKDKEIVELAKKYAISDKIKASIVKASENKSLFKSLTFGKFALSTILTTATYLGLTKFRHKYTENQIINDYLKNRKKDSDYNFEFSYPSAFDSVHKSQKQPSFTGGLQNFIFDPVKNLMLVDASITGERLTHARNPQDFLGYVIKEGSFWMFMYFAGPLIAKGLEKTADKVHNKSIALDARVIESEEFAKVLKDGSLKKHLEAFKKADKSDAKLYEYAVTKFENLIIEFAKKSDIIELTENGMVDTRKYIDLKELRGVGEKIEKVITQYETSNQTFEDFIKGLRKLKRASVLKNMGACIGALGIVAPAIMLITRRFNPDYQVKKDIEAKLITEK